jgi:signal transduction protein with GAF and PtsI domain
VGDGADRFEGILSEVRRILSEGGRFTDAAPRILGMLSETLGWDVAIAWRQDEATRVLHFVASWHDPSGPRTQLETVSERSTLTPGVGLPGRIVAAREPCWITDVQTDRGFPRSPAAMEDGLHGGFGFPLLHNWKVVGVMEFFAHETRELDEDLLVSIAQLGPELGDVMAGESWA